jgi:hypothetical protein
VGENEKYQVRGKKAIDEALDESIELEGGEEKSSWQGADAEIAKKRPESVLNSDYDFVTVLYQ